MGTGNDGQDKAARSSAKWFGLACLGLAFAAVLGACVVCSGAVAWFVTLPEGGVLLTNEVPDYAREYIAEHDLVEADETILAYYDDTLRLNGSETTILTDRRLIYHSEAATTSIPLREIEDIQHMEDPLIGDIFIVVSESGRTMRIEIANFNGGETFHAVLMRAWRNAGD